MVAPKRNPIDPDEFRFLWRSMLSGWGLMVAGTFAFRSDIPLDDAGPIADQYISPLMDALRKGAQVTPATFRQFADLMRQLAAELEKTRT